MGKKRSSKSVIDERASYIDSNGWKDKLKRQLELIHVCNPKYIFLTESAAISNGYILKEAWKKAYPDEKPPIFYRVNPRADIFSNSYPPSSKKKKIVEDFFKKRIKDRDAGIMIYDEMGVCESSERIQHFLKNPEEYGYSPDIKCSRVFQSVLGRDDCELEAMRSGRLHLALPNVPEGYRDLPYTKEQSEERVKDLYKLTPRQFEAKYKEKPVRKVYGKLLDKFLHLSGTQVSGHTFDDSYITSKNSGKSLAYQSPRRKYAATHGKSEIDHGLRGVITGNQEFVGFCKTYGKELGEELHEELQRRQQREDLTSKVAGFFAIGGFVASLFFMASNFTGNVIGNLNGNSESTIGIILFLVGLVGTFFYFGKRDN